MTIQITAGGQYFPVVPFTRVMEVFTNNKYVGVIVKV